MFTAVPGVPDSVEVLHGPVAEPVLPLPGASSEEHVDAGAPATPQDRFRAGYLARAQGDPYLVGLLDHFVVNVIGSCECRSWDCGYGLHVSVAQFSADTWEKARRAVDADGRDPWEAGWATAEWVTRIKGREGTTAGWPGCWWR